MAVCDNITMKLIATKIDVEKNYLLIFNKITIFTFRFNSVQL
jgi:hypothetical protein